MAPRPQRMRTPTAKGAELRAATVEPSVSMMAPPETPPNTDEGRKTRSGTARADTQTSHETAQNIFTTTPAAAPKELHLPQNVAELIVMKRDSAQNTIEGQSISPFDDVSRAQGSPKRGPSKQQGRTQRAPSKSATPSSGITKSAGKGRRSTPRAGATESPATTPNNMTPATTTPTTTPANAKLAAMLDELREHGRETENATKRAEIALKENIAAGKEAKDAVRQVKKLALAAKKEAIKVAERANRERDEALEATKEAWRIGERYR